MAAVADKAGKEAAAKAAAGARAAGYGVKQVWQALNSTADIYSHIASVRIFSNKGCEGII